MLLAKQIRAPEDSMATQTLFFESSPVLKGASPQTCAKEFTAETPWLDAQTLNPKPQPCEP